MVKLGRLASQYLLDLRSFVVITLQEDGTLVPKHVVIDFNCVLYCILLSEFCCLIFWMNWLIISVDMNLFVKTSAQKLFTIFANYTTALYSSQALG